MASEEINSLLNEARKSKFSTIGQRLSDDDVLHIWNGVSEFIEKYMSQQKGVQIQGLGVFSFVQKKIEIGNNKHLLIQRPVFMLSEKFAQTHGLTYTKYHSPGQIPVVQLNYTALSCASPYDRDLIESCLKEILQALNRSVAAKKNVEFTFVGIGRLQIREGRVKMKFFRHFINCMDGSGSLVESMQNRPGTADSVITDRAPSRMPTPNTLLLPKLGHGVSKSMDKVMPTIEEDNVVEEPNAEAQLNYLPEFGQEEGYETGRSLDLVIESGREQMKETGRSDDLAHAPMPVAAGISFNDELAPRPPSSRLSAAHPLSKSSPVALREFESARTPLSDIKPSSPPVVCTEPPLKPPSPPAELRQVNKSVHWRHSPKSPCGHQNAGQELCYLCHQRERVNIPVSFAEERARREMEESRLLQQFNELKDTEAAMKDEAQNMTRRHENQKAAAFNLGVSEAMKINKQTRPTDFYPSFVFQRRPYTPPRYIKQGELHGELEKQVLDKRVRTETQRADQQFLERLEQVQLAEDLAAQRDKYLRDKHDQRERYQRALSAQVRCKPQPLPAAEPNSAEPVFGRDDLTQEKLMERRRIAHELYQEQLDLVAQKKRDAILKRLAAQKDEEDVLRRTKEELLQDRASRFDRIVRMRKHLEDNWSGATNSKVSREKEERQRSSSPGLLVHEQCDRYRRCRNCKRHLNNYGQSNIWCDTRYIPGSRLIV